MEPALAIPLEMSADCAALAHGVTLGVLFSRGKALSLERVQLLCQRINQEGQGVIGVSAILSPNSLLLIGQYDTMVQFKRRLNEVCTERIYIRLNEHQWPPLHTPIVWQRNVTNRSQVAMLTMPGGFRTPKPALFSLATGGFHYTESSVREVIGKWVDQPQRLWDAVDATLSLGTKTILHVGPEPNIIPATFQRVAANVQSQRDANIGVRALGDIADRPWLKTLLPRRAALLRATKVRHIILEDWLLDVAGPELGARREEVGVRSEE